MNERRTIVLFIMVLVSCIVGYVTAVANWPVWTYYILGGALWLVCLAIAYFIGGE